MGMEDCSHEYRFNLHRVSCLVTSNLSAPNEAHQTHQIEEPHLLTPPTRYVCTFGGPSGVQFLYAHAIGILHAAIFSFQQVLNMPRP
jgi:hypothetical protein